ncbi:MAG: hypothetical protein GEU80_04750 [Dehalococcoidia bacterium]|nr:hypothetical protein [Dehalococcoidia bacterium]
MPRRVTLARLGVSLSRSLSPLVRTPRGWPSPRSGVFAIVAALCLLLLGPALAAAQGLPTLDERIVDQTDTLSGDQRDRALAAFEDLEQDAGVQLFALFVESTGDTTASDFVAQVADANGLDGNDALLVVAMSDRRDAIWVGPLLDEVSDDELDLLLADRIEPELSAGAYGQALVAAAEGLRDARGATLQTQDADNGGGGGIGGFVAVLLLLAGGAALFLWWRSRRPGEPRTGPPGQATAEPERDLDDLAREANNLLLETDEAVRQNIQELGFAEAQFGAAEVEPFRKALDEARASLRDAFALRQQLDDSDPETEAEQRQMLGEIIQRCESAQGVMAEQREHFQTLRNMERDASELLEQLPGALAASEAHIVESEHRLEQVRAEAPASAEEVAGNIEEARKRLAAAREAIEAGHAALGQEAGAAAALSVRTAQETVAQAAQLLGAIDQLAVVLDEARTNGQPLRADVASDLAAARALLEEHPDPALRARLDKLDARMSAAPPGDDLVREYRQLQQVDSAANALLAAATEGAESRNREETAVRLAIRSAETQVNRAEAFLESRRHGIGRVPRTRITDAERELDRARDLATEQPQEALAAATRAGELADDAYEMARQEFGAYDERHGGGRVVTRGGTLPGGGGWGGGGMLAGAILGSILSGGRGGGFGGFGGGSSRGGGFGGGGGGGGGRSRGGGW